MCRMFAYTGNSYNELISLYTALKKSAKNDVIGDRIGINDHKDGYGYVIYNNGKIINWRSDAAIYSENPVIPELSGNIYAIFHARKASDIHMGVFYSHPLSVSTGDKVIFLAHNGLADSEKLMKELKLNGEFSDSELVLEYIKQNGISSVEKIENSFTKSALNLLILDLNKINGKAIIYALNFYKNPVRKEYSDMFISNLKNGRAIISSTLKCYGIPASEQMEYGKLISIE